MPRLKLKMTIDNITNLLDSTFRLHTQATLSPDDQLTDLTHDFSIPEYIMMARGVTDTLYSESKYQDEIRKLVRSLRHHRTKMKLNTKEAEEIETCKAKDISPWDLLDWFCKTCQEAYKEIN